jgi:two-component system OmpR family response regulator
MHLLLIEDERRLAELLGRSLREEGHRVSWAPDLAEARILLATDDGPELLIVDRMLPDGDGLDLIRTLRARGDRRPALCLTARDQVDERVEGLHGGADDYIGKPFALEELLARVAALARRLQTADPELRVGDLHLDAHALRAWRAGEELRLTAQEFKLLRYLAEHQGHVLSKSRILNAVWEIQHDPGTNLVEIYISYLRAKVDKGAEYPLIHTVRGLGYVLECRPRP